MSINICPCFYTTCQSLESCLIRIYVIILQNHKHCQVLWVHICAAVTINMLFTKQQIYTQPQRLAQHTNTQTNPVACSHFGPLCCLSRRQWWLFSKLTPPTKLCDHLSCQLASAETTNQPTVILALKISPQKMCHLHMFRTQRHIFHFYFLLICMCQTLSAKPWRMSVLYVWHCDLIYVYESVFKVDVNSSWMEKKLYTSLSNIFDKENDAHFLIPHEYCIDRASHYCVIHKQSY